MGCSTSDLGQKRRLVQWMAVPRLPLYAVSDQTRAAVQYIAMGQLPTCCGAVQKSQIIRELVSDR